MSSSRQSRIVERAGFTLFELLVVIVVIGILAAVVVPDLIRPIADSNVRAATMQIENFGLALDQYRLDNHAYPATEQGLTSLRVRPTSGATPPNWRGPYLRRDVPNDPWGRPYEYVSPGRANPDRYDLYTLGRDGRQGGEGEDADLTSWGGPLP